MGNIIYILVIFLSILFTIIALKRIAILALSVGYILYLINTKKFKKGLINIIVVLLFLFLTAPLYYDVFIQRLEVRAEESMELDQEQRYFDMQFAFHDFRTKGIKHALIGPEAFNTPGYFGRVRQVHVDYANLLISTGIIGLSLYLWIYFSIYSEFRRLYRFIKKNDHLYRKTDIKYWQDLNGVFSAVLVASLIVSFSGGMHVITARSILFCILGGLSGIIYKNHLFLNIKYRLNQF